MDEKLDINRLVQNEESIHKIKDGKKTAIRRNDRYADPGEMMNVAGETFIIEKVYQQKLGKMTEENAQEEGFDDLTAYKASLTSIHHGAVWDPEYVVWVHELKRPE